MTVRHTLAAAASLALATVPGHALAACKLGRVAELPVTMNGTRPMVPAKINGAPAEFIVDSGAFYSSITPAAASQFNLHLQPAPYGLHIVGVGGSTQASVTTVSVFTLANAPLRNLQFIVGGGEVGFGAAGLIGQNILRLADTEYDLANGVVRIWRAEDCRRSMLAYWVTNQPFSVIDIDWTTAGAPHTIGTASLNGTKIRVLFDTGAATSLVTLRAAERAGFKPDEHDASASGLVRGIGAEAVRGWTAPFASFKIGGEEIRNTRLRIADSRLVDVDMLIGADFFLSHRIYVANSQHKLYFTYNGGPVFNLAAPPPARASTGPPSKTSEPPEAPGAEPTDAAGFSRRGAAFAAREQLDQAIADFTRACKLAPTNPEYFYQRGVARLQNRQPQLALADFDQALKLQPDDVPALVSRATLRLAAHDTSGAAGDLDAAARLAPKEADVRLGLGILYIRARSFAPAVAQLDLWLANHGEDSRRADALNDRCWARALSGQDLKKALRDCDAALRLRPATSHFLDSRALVEQRLGVLDKSIADYDAALQTEPKNAWMLYARGVAELHAGRTPEGKSDIAAATALQPRIAEVARARGIAP